MTLGDRKTYGNSKFQCKRVHAEGVGAQAKTDRQTMTGATRSLGAGRPTFSRIGTESFFCHRRSLRLTTSFSDQKRINFLGKIMVRVFSDKRMFLKLSWTGTSLVARLSPISRRRRSFWIAITIRIAIGYPLVTFSSNLTAASRLRARA